jgi:hypothetical protein
MNRSLPWHGAREMDMMLMHMSIESLTKYEDVVFDASASTCTCSHTLSANNIKYGI